MISNETPFDKLRHKNRIATSFLAVSLAFILFTGSFLAVPLAFSQTNMTTTTSSINKEEIISSQVKSFILDQIVNKSKAAIVIGFVDPNGTRIFSFGNMSIAHNIPVNENTLFNIGSITKTFTTLLLADMVKQGLVNLTDPIERYLPSSVRYLSLMARR